MVAEKVARPDTTAEKSPPKRVRTESEREAIIEAKRQAQQISHYLRSLSGPKSIDPEVLARKIADAEKAVKSSTGLRRLVAVQRHRDLERQTTANQSNPYEDEFIKYAKDYGEKNGIEYGSWRKVGVTAAVLKKAGIARTSD